MGSQQFASGMTDVDKAQLERIETLVENVTWHDNYSPMIYENSISNMAVGTSVELVNIVGGGYLSEAFFYGNNARIEITLDGVLVFKTGNTDTANGAFGIVPMARVIVINGGTGVLIPNNDTSVFMPAFTKNGDNFPVVKASVPTAFNGCAVLNEPIYFKNSCSVKIIQEGANLANPRYSVKGGRKV